MLLDRSGVLWVGMLGHGLYKYRIGSDRFKIFLPKLSVQRIAILDNDVIYVHGWNAVSSVTSEGFECVDPLKFVVKGAPYTKLLQAKDGGYWAYRLVERKLIRYTADIKNGGQLSGTGKSYAH